MLFFPPVAPFRSKGRIPILSWVHPVNGASITRSSQPLVGLGKEKRNREDEQLVKEIIQTNPRRALKILDARPKVNATANKARGAGYENVSRYGNNDDETSDSSPSTSLVRERGMLFAGDKREGSYKPKTGQHFLNNTIGHSGLSEKEKKALEEAAQIAEGGGGTRVRSRTYQPDVVAEAEKEESKSNVKASPSSSEKNNFSPAGASGATGGVYVYPLEFLGIENIHVMRDAERKLKELCFSSSREDKGWFSALESTRWLEHINLLISCTRKIVLSLQEGISVFTHCSDGWDRTSQLTSLPMLCLDPYYRTIAGFAVLVEKEWLSIGHKFAQRYGHGDKHYDDKDRSPIFLQFIDCVWQLKQQFPTCFEFNQLFLAEVMDAVYSCQYGTFLFNSQKEREKANVKKKTLSVWTVIEGNKAKYVDRSYRESDKGVLVPVAGLKNVSLWSFYYLRYSQYNEDNDFLWYLFDGGGAKALKKKKKTEEGKKIRELAKALKAMEAEKERLEKKNRELIDLMEEKEEGMEPQDPRKPVRRTTQVIHNKMIDVERQNEILQKKNEKLRKKLLRKDKQLEASKKQIDTQLEDYVELKNMLSVQRKKEKWMREELEKVPKLNLEELELDWESRLEQSCPNWKERLESKLAEEEKEPDEITELFIQPALTPSAAAQRGALLGSQRRPTKGEDESSQPEEEEGKEKEEEEEEEEDEEKKKEKIEEEKELRRKRQKTVSDRHRSIGKKLIPFLIRRPTRAELVDRNILPPEDVYTDAPSSEPVSPRKLSSPPPLSLPTTTTTATTTPTTTTTTPSSPRHEEPEKSPRAKHAIPVRRAPPPPLPKKPPQFAAGNNDETKSNGQEKTEKNEKQEGSKLRKKSPSSEESNGLPPTVLKKKKKAKKASDSEIVRRPSAVAHNLNNNNEVKPKPKASASVIGVDPRRKFFESKESLSSSSSSSGQSGGDSKNNIMGFVPRWISEKNVRTTNSPNGQQTTSAGRGGSPRLGGVQELIQQQYFKKGN